MNTARLAAFALPVLCFSSINPQQTPPTATPAYVTSTDAKAAAQAPPLPDASLLAPALSPRVTEEEIRQMLAGKQLYLRGLWLDDELHFDLTGALIGQSAKGSFTLCAVQIDKVHLTKRRLELEGVRYGIHFAGEASWENQAASFDRIRVTPKKKHLRVIIDRQVVITPKKKKGERTPAAETAAAPGTSAKTGPAAVTQAETDPQTTINPAESSEHLRAALNRIFAPSLDARMIAEMPDYWQFFYQAQMAHRSMEPTDPGIVRPGPGIDGPRLVKNVVAASNDYAQRSEVAGVASYKVILGTDGKPMAVAVFKPIGFGLDEKAVAAIRKSTFAPALKNGKPVPSVIDLAVNFRIYSKRTEQASPVEPGSADAPSVSPATGNAALPGLYTTMASH